MPRTNKVPWKQNPSRNHFLIKGIERYGRSAMHRKTGRWVKKFTTPPKVERPKRIFKPLVKVFQKGTRKLYPKAPRFYSEDPNFKRPYSQRKSKRHNFVLVKPGEESKIEILPTKEKKEKGTKKAASKSGAKKGATAETMEETKEEETKTEEMKTEKTASKEGEEKPKTKKVGRKPVPRSRAKLRKSITPGTILIMLAGRFRGRKVVFLKQLTSGLLLITGPYKINGIPIRRVNQSYVIATSTRIGIRNKVPKHITDSYFRKEKKMRTKKSEADFFSRKATKGKKKNTERLAVRKADQIAVDEPLIKSIKKIPILKHYMRARFSIPPRQYPHLLKF